MKPLAFLGGIFLVFLLVLFYGLVLSVLWEWFIGPLFGLPLLSIPQAVGLSLVVGFLTHQSMPEDKADGALLRVMVRGALLPLLALFYGWIIHLFL